MISDGIEKFQAIVEGGIRIGKLGNNGPRHDVYDIKGELKEVVRNPPARNHSVATIESLARAAKRLGDASDLTIWVCLTKVVVVLDDAVGDHRIDTISLPLSKSPMFDALESLVTRELDQKELVRMLDHDFSPADVSPESVTLAVSKLKFETHDEMEGEVKPGSDRMGREIMSKVSGAGEIPERVYFEFHPYPSLEEEVNGNVTVTCSLRALAEKRKLHLCPLPGDLEAARVQATSFVRARVEEEFGEGFHVFCGTP